jgi:biopolymer transport protein ExbD
MEERDTAVKPHQQAHSGLFGGGLLERSRKSPQINIVPLVDVLTVLLFFFLVTMQFKQLSALNLTLPEIRTAGQSQVVESVVIAIAADGALFLNERPVTEAELREGIRILGSQAPETPVLLMADEATALRYITMVMDICRSNRLNRIRLQSR